MVLLFYVNDCLTFRTSKYNIDYVYASLQVGFNFQDDGDINKYLGIELVCVKYVSIHIRQTYFNQMITNLILGTDKPSAKTNP